VRRRAQLVVASEPATHQNREDAARARFWSAFGGTVGSVVDCFARRSRAATSATDVIRLDGLSGAASFEATTRVPPGSSGLSFK